MAENKSDNIELNGIKNYAASLKLFYLKLFSFGTNAVTKYWYILLMGILLGTGLAYYKFRNTEPYYDAKATLNFSNFNKKLFGEMIEKLRHLSLSGSYKTLSEKLNITEAEAKRILDIEALNIAGSPLEDDITEVKQPFYIRVKLQDRQMADSLLVRIENYLNSNPQVKMHMANNLIKLREKLAYTNEQIHKLDSLKTAYKFYLGQQTINSGGVVNTFNPVDLFTASEKLFSTKADLEWGIINNKVVKVLDPFIIDDFPVVASLANLLIKYAGLGLVIGILLSLVLYTFKKI
jgi:hypothetical protein